MERLIKDNIIFRKKKYCANGNKTDVVKLLWLVV
jgi:hypothetical protein